MIVDVNPKQNWRKKFFSVKKNQSKTLLRKKLRERERERDRGE